MTLRFAFYCAQLAVILCRYLRGKKCEQLNGCEEVSHMFNPSLCAFVDGAMQ
jgi:hypothetical protein